jgi:hypothetical protein
MVVMYWLFACLLRCRGRWRRIEGLCDVVIRSGAGRGRPIKLKRLEQIIELIVFVVALHVGSSPPPASERSFPSVPGVILPWMIYFLSIRVAEPWTPFSVAAMVLLTVLLVTAVVLLVRRS